MTARLTAALVLLVTLLGTAHGDDSKRAEKYLERAVEFYRYGRYASAAIEFSKAYRLKADPPILFAWAQAERLDGNCKKASKLYRRFIATAPPQSDIDAAQSFIEKCDRSEGDRAAPDDKPARNGEANGRGSPAPGPEERPDSDSAAGEGPVAGTTDAHTDGVRPLWYNDRRGAIMTTAGGGIIVFSLGLYLSARSLSSSAADASSDDEFDDIFNRARNRRNLAVLLGLSGSVLVTLGLLRYRHVREAQRSSVTVSPVITDDTAGLLLIGRF
ncbi:MAG: hypothetical protein AAGC55_02180 [Myxococcota bacterium]